MPNVFEGNLSVKGLKIAIVASRFNDFIGERLLEGAMDTLLRSGMDGKDIDVFKVPGTFEMPLVVTTLARQKSHDAIICVGAVIRGSTPHFDFVAREAAQGIAKASVEFGVPIALGRVNC